MSAKKRPHNPSNKPDRKDPVWRDPSRFAGIVTAAVVAGVVLWAVGKLLDAAAIEVSTHLLIAWR